MTPPTLFAHPLSLFSRKAQLVLLFQGIEHDYRMTAPHADDPEFAAASPLGKIPAFKDEHAALADSSVITHYLNKFYGGNKLIPESRAAYARALWFEEYADTVMAPIIGFHLYAEMVLAERVFKRPANPGDIDKAINQELPGVYKFLDGELRGRQWLAGDELTIADIAVGGLLLTLYHCRQTVPDSAEQLRSFAERFFELAPVQQVLAQEVRTLQAIQYDTPLAQCGADGVPLVLRRPGL